MIELVPVMLFILGWHPDRPGEIDLQRPETLFVSTAECEDAGAKLAGRMSEVARAKDGAIYEHRCVEIPPVSEFETLFEQLEKQGR